MVKKMTDSPQEVEIIPYLEIEPDEYANCVSFSPSGVFLTIGNYGKTVSIIKDFKVDNIRKLQHKYPVYATEWSPRGEFLATGGIDGPIKIWEVKNWEAIKTLPNSKGAMNLSWSSDGRFLAVGSWYCSSERKAEVWSTKDWARIETKNDLLPRYLSFSPKGNYLALAYLLEGIEILSVPDFERVALLDFSDSKKHVDIFSPSWSSDGQFIAASCGDGRVRVWSAKDWSEIVTMKLHSYWDEAEYQVAFSLDSRYLISGGYGMPKLLSTTNWWLLHTFEDVIIEDKLDLTWHPNGNLVAIVSQKGTPVKIFQIK